jgi:hypothetical protein
MENIPSSVSYENQTYYLDQYFVSQVLDLEGLARLDTRDVRWVEKEITLSLKKAVIKEGSDEEPEVIEGGYESLNYPKTWWDSFKITVVRPYIRKLGLEKTWLSHFAKGEWITHSYYKVTQLNKNYWTLVVAPPDTNVYKRARLYEVLRLKNNEQG